MKSNLFLLLLLLLGSCRSKSIREIEFAFGEYEFEHEIDQLFAATKDGGLVATRYSFVGAHKKLIDALSSNADTVERISPSDWNQIKEEYTFQKATDYIIREAEKHEWVLINEAHAVPQHRNFVRRLLPALSKAGFKYLALEAIGMTSNGMQNDTSIEERGYPTIHSGFYIKEPEFGQLIREAVQHGFEIIGYDQGSGSEREILGAQHILKQIEADGKRGKTLVLCGWDHIKEEETGTYWEYALAGRLKEFTGEDPLTINQTQYYERSQGIYEDSIFQHVDIDQPMVLLNANGESFDVERNTNWYDLFVFHPRTKYVEGFPHWIVETNPITTIKLPEIMMTCPCKVFLYAQNDDITKAVPLYIHEISTIERRLRLPLNQKEKYKLVLSNKNISYLIE